MQHVPTPDYGDPSLPTEPPVVTYLTLWQELIEANVYLGIIDEGRMIDNLHRAVNYRYQADAHAFDATHSFSERN